MLAPEDFMTIQALVKRGVISVTSLSSWGSIPGRCGGPLNVAGRPPGVAVGAGVCSFPTDRSSTNCWPRVSGTPW
jgi:hypothetical protein